MTAATSSVDIGMAFLKSEFANEPSAPLALISRNPIILVLFLLSA